MNKFFTTLILCSTVSVVSAKNIQKNFDDIPYNSFLETEINWSITQGIFPEKSPKIFGMRDAITKSELEKAFTILRCSPKNPYSLKSMEGRANFQHIKKSEFVRELVHIISNNRPKKTDGSFNFPDGWESIVWADIKKSEKHYGAAQILLKMGILDENNGYFGYEPVDDSDPGDKDPGILREQMLLWLSRSFDLGQCGFKVFLDRDHDGVENNVDLCREIPGNTAKNGCPNITRVAHEKKPEISPKFISRPGLKKNNLTLWSGIEIKFGDIFFAAVINPKTKEMVAKSLRIIVTEKKTP